MNNRIVKCLICKKSVKESEMIERRKNTHDLLRYDWGIPRWVYVYLKCCPECNFPLICDNEIIDYKKRLKKNEV